MSLNPPIKDWQGKRVWLIGASSGIGAELARALVARGARLALSARNVERLSAFAAQLPGSLALPLDASKLAQLQAGYEVLQHDWGGVDVAIFNAGTYTALRADGLVPEIAADLIQTNLLGVMDGVACVLPGMLAAGKGQLVIVASVAGYNGLPRALAYGPSKAALINFAESLYLDLAPRGLGVTLVNPGFVRTRLTAQNDFYMPALMEPAMAARRIMEGLGRGAFEIHFPRRFTLFLKLLRMLPYSISLRLLARIGER